MKFVHTRREAEDAKTFCKTHITGTDLLIDGGVMASTVTGRFELALG